MHFLKLIIFVIGILNISNISKADNFLGNCNIGNEAQFLNTALQLVDEFNFKTRMSKEKLVYCNLSNKTGITFTMIPYNKDFSWEKGSVYFGSSLLALFNLALKKDYHLVATDSACVNAFFVRGDLKKDFKILDPKINFKVPLRYSKDEINSAKKYLLSQNLKYFKE